MKQIKKLCLRVFSSIFIRSSLWYALIIIVTIGVFGVVQSRVVIRIIEDDLLAYNAGLLQTLEERFSSQLTHLKLTLRRMYSVQIYNNRTVFDQLHISMVSNQSQDMQELMTHNRILVNHFQMNEQPNYPDVAQFMVLSRSPVAATGIHFSSVNHGHSIRAFATQIAPLLSNEGTDINEPRIHFTTPIVLQRGGTTDLFYVIYDYLRMPTDPEQYIGYLVTAYPFSVLDTLLASNWSGAADEVFLLDRNFDVIYSSPDARADISELYSTISRQRQTQFEWENNLVSSIWNSRYNFYVLSITEMDTFYAPIRNQSISMIVLAAVLAGIGVILATVSSRRLASRVNRIIASMHAWENGDLSARAPIGRHRDEFDNIASNFNELSERLDEYIQRHYRDELRNKDLMLNQKEASMRALQAQVSPHFLYNTLEMIRMSALKEQEGEAAYAISTLAELFKNRIKSDVVITIREELQFCHNLFKIYSMKYSGEIEVNIHINEEVADFAIPKDTIQPLVENIIAHAFTSGNQPEKIVSLEQNLTKDGDVRIIVSDNGDGLSESEIEKLLASCNVFEPSEEKGIGLQNIHQRIKLIYGDAYGLSVKSNNGTTVTVTIPCMSISELKMVMKT